MPSRSALVGVRARRGGAEPEGARCTASAGAGPLRDAVRAAGALEAGTRVTLLLLAVEGLEGRRGCGGDHALPGMASLGLGAVTARCPLPPTTTVPAMIAPGRGFVVAGAAGADDVVRTLLVVRVGDELLLTVLGLEGAAALSGSSLFDAVDLDAIMATRGSLLDWPVLVEPGVGDLEPGVGDLAEEGMWPGLGEARLVGERSMRSDCESLPETSTSRAAGRDLSALKEESPAEGEWDIGGTAGVGGLVMPPAAGIGVGVGRSAGGRTRRMMLAE
jgi:hypothetical protein